MRKTLRKLARMRTHKRSPLNGHSEISKMYSTTVRKIKRRPVVSIGTIALALGALSGVVAWMRSRK